MAAQTIQRDVESTVGLKRLFKVPELPVARLRAVITKSPPSQARPPTFALVAGACEHECGYMSDFCRLPMRLPLGWFAGLAYRAADLLLTPHLRDVEAFLQQTARACFTRRSDVVPQTARPTRQYTRLKHVVVRVLLALAILLQPSVVLALASSTLLAPSFPPSRVNNSR